MIKTTIFLLLVSLFSYSVFGQVSLEFINPLVSVGNQNLEYAFAGGVNSAQYQSIDMDNDGDLDLLLFDRASDKVNTFENLGSAYVYQPAFEFLFPDDIEHWIVLADYDCDNKKDLFTYTGQGIRVFRNISASEGLIWELVVDPLKTQGSSSQINLLFNPTDIPSISDVDGDGDLDILVFDFASSEQIEFHRNRSFELSGSCGLSFERETRTYGEIRDCNCDDFKVDQPCASSGRILHAGGKALLSLDFNLDGLMDIVLSQEGCDNLSFAENTGTNLNVSFNAVTNDFPTFTSPLAFTSFPAAFFEDVTFDGKRDLLISSNERSNTERNIDFKSSSFVFQNQGDNTANQFLTASSFLQNQMIDVGEFAYPALADINGDGSNDLIIGNSGRLLNGQYFSSLSYYQSGSTSLVWQSDDLFGLSALELNDIKPQFVELDNDDQIDLVFSARDATNTVKLYYLINQSESEISFDLSKLQAFESNLNSLDDFHFDDVDQNGVLDLLLGLSSGRLDYYRNSGTSISPVFSLETSGYLGIVDKGEKSNLSLTTGDIDGDGAADLITTDRSGRMGYYSNYKTGNSTLQESLVKLDDNSELQPSRLGRISKPVSGQLLGRNVVGIGSIQGGIRLLSSARVSNENTLIFTAFPVPASGDRLVKFISNQSNTLLEIFTLAGKKVTELRLTAYTTTELDLSFLDDGLYLAKATSGGQSCTQKIVVSAGE